MLRGSSIDAGSCEAKGDEDALMTSVHDMRAAEPTSSVLPPTKADSKPAANAWAGDDDEKPTWQEVMETAFDEPAIDASAPNLEGETSNDLDSITQQEHVVVVHLSRQPDADVSVPQAQLDPLQQQSFMDTRQPQAITVHARLDSLEAPIEASIEARLSAQFSAQGRAIDSVAESVAEQGRAMDDRLGKLELTMQRIEQLLMTSGTTTA